MDGAYRVSGEAQTVTVDASTAVGEIVNAVFTHFGVKEFGRNAFSVCRLMAEVLA
jgi:hypothetical protein